MDFVTLAIGTGFGALGAAITMVLTFGKWVVNQNTSIRLELQEVKTKQENDREAKERILDTLEQIRKEL